MNNNKKKKEKSTTGFCWLKAKLGKKKSSTLKLH